MLKITHCCKKDNKATKNQLMQKQFGVEYFTLLFFGKRCHFCRYEIKRYVMTLKSIHFLLLVNNFKTFYFRVF